MIETTLLKAEEKMKTTVDILKRDLSGVRTGRASTALIDHVRVDYNGVPTPMNHIANVSVSGTSLLIIQPWDPNILSGIEKAILKSNIGLTPNSDGTVIRLSIPPLSEERRAELTKMVKKMTEDQKIAIRNIRRDAIEDIKKLEKNKEISQDDLKRGEGKLQKLTDSFIGVIDGLESTKAAELKQV
ncbi:MAG: ribosome recycling factor [Dehalococcoidia bacterium]|nr:ribosome recycling factor [Dehalococcoidia bacterium]